MDDLPAILLIIFGNGVVMAIATLILNSRTARSERRLKAKQEAHQFYLTLYSHIAYLEELIRAYRKSKLRGKVQVFIRGQHELRDLTRDEIEPIFNKAYKVFLTYYQKEKCSGYEIYLSRRLRKLLLQFQWLLSSGTKMEDITRYVDANFLSRRLRNLSFQFQWLIHSGTNLEDTTRYGDTDHIVSEIREQMEKNFGLK